MKRYLYPVLVSGFIFFFQGCSVDSVQVARHPSQIKPGDTMNVGIVNFYVFATNSSTVLLGTTRDSIHAVVGVPKGWEVTSAGFYAARDFKIVKMIDSPGDTALLRRMLADSLAKFSSGQSPMIADKNLERAFSGRIITAHDTLNRTRTPVATDSIGNWFGFSSKVDISIASGSKTDTTLKITDSLLKMLPDTTIKASSIPFDSAGLIVVPVFVFAKVKAGQDEGDFKVYYYTKTGDLPPVVADTTNPVARIDRGDMVFCNVNVSRLNPVSYFVNKKHAPTFTARQSGGKIIVDLPGSMPGSQLSIYAIDGREMASFTISGTTMVWNPGNNNIGPLLPGSYVVKLESGTFSSCIRYLHH